jgi:type I restriction enzyme S subunit
MSDIKEQLPFNWNQSSLMKICNVRTGKKDANHENPTGKYRFYTCAYNYIMCDTKSFEGECLILPGNGANVGEVFYYNGEFEAYQRTYIIEKIGIFPKYLFYHLLANWKKINSDKQYGSATNYIRIGNFENYIVKVPPLNEQKRIVAKIEGLFSELDKGIESLKTARAQLKIYRQAVLKHAFEGKLTADWREKNKDKLESADQLLARIKREQEKHYKQELKEYSIALKNWGKDKGLNKPSKPKKIRQYADFSVDELSALPKHSSEHWKWVKLDRILADNKYAIKAGPFGSSIKKEFYVSEGYKIYGQEQVICGNVEYGNYYIDKEKYKELESCKVAPNDVLISLVGTVGKVLILPESAKPGIINPRLVKISLNTKHYLPEFFKYFFESSFVKNIYKFLAKGTTMDVLNVGIIESLPFPLCSIEEQLILIKKIEDRLSVVEKIEQEIENNLQKSEVLRQSILKKAFSGQLVAQDPADEPASVLLERIRAEKAPHTAKKKPKEKRRAA